MLCDFILEGSGLKDRSVDYAMLLISCMQKNQKGFLKRLTVS
jgi:hypothetical protein